MAEKPTYEELEQRVRELERTVDDYRQVKEDLYKKSAQFESIFKAIPDVAVFVDFERRIVMTNSALTRVFGYKQEEVISKHAEILYASKEAYEEQGGLRFHLSAEEKLMPYEIMYRRKNGEIFPSETVGAIVKNDKGNTIGFLGIIRDITRRKQAEEALKQSERDLRIRNQINNIFLTYPDEKMYAEVLNVIQSVMESEYGTFGYFDEDGSFVAPAVTRKIYWDKCNVQEKNIIFQKGTFSGIWGRAIKEKKSLISDDGPFNTPKGHIPIKNTMVTPIIFHDEVISAIHIANKSGGYDEQDRVMLKTIAHQIAPVLYARLQRDKLDKERKQAEEALRESEEKYKELVSSLPQIVFETDEKGALTFANRSAFDIFGYTKSEFDKGLNAIQMLIPEDRDRAMENIQRILSGDILGGIEYTALRKDDSTFPVLIHSKLFMRDNKPMGMRGIIIDLSEQKRYEETLRESEFRFRSLFDFSPQAIALTEMESGRLIDVNDKFCKLTKYGREEVLDRITTEVRFYSKSDRGRFIKELQESGEVHGLEMDFKIKDGSVIKALMFARPINIAGKACILTVFLDVTEQKRLEAQLQQAQKMESIGTLAGGIAHDFNNILFPIVGYTEMTMDDVPEDSTAHRNLKEILSSALRARDLVQQILTFSRKQNQELKPLKTQIVVREALKLIRSSLPTTIEISQNIDKDCGLVMADPTQIHQIVMNLCTNAYHAMDDTGGTLEVNLNEVELTVDDITGLDMEPGPYLCLKVGDTGEGMDQSVIERIFDPYFTTKETGKGTGLGLAVVHGIVKSYGGDIRVYSEVDKGSVFHVYLPRIKEASVSPETVVSDEELQTGHERILLVDDEEAIVSMEKQMMEKLGYHVTARTSSIEALEAFRAQPDKFDLVITDMTMPNMTGDRLAGELMNIRPDIPIILCTGFSEKISRERADALGIKGFLMKPIAMKDLAKTIRKALDE